MHEMDTIKASASEKFHGAEFLSENSLPNDKTEHHSGDKTKITGHDTSILRGLKKRLGVGAEVMSMTGTASRNMSWE